jgi:RNA polymerase-binding transcription factor DksA
MSIDTINFKNKLEEEKVKLEKELSSVARKNPDNPSEWQPISTEHDASEADENIIADVIEDYEGNTAITNSLETRYNDVKSGLDKIAKGTYGTCQICNKEIELDRLEANPAARTCKEHINSSL